MDKLALKYTAAGIGAVMLGTLLLYWPGLSGSFIFDDRTNILRAWIENPDFDALKYTLTHNTSGPLGRVVSMFSFILTGLIYGTDPWGYKFHNLLLHLANGLLLFFLLARILPTLKPTLDQRRALLIAGVTCTFWLVHPLLVSTVLYAVQRMAQLAVFFTLLSLLCYVALRRCETFNARFVVLGWVLFPCCMLLALLSKETGVLIPVFLLLFELVAYRVTIAELRRRRPLALWLGVFVLLPLLVGSAGTLIFFDDLVASYNTRPFTLGERLMTQLHVVANYVRMILAPQLRGMGLFQDDFPLTTRFDVVTALLLAALLAVLAGLWLLRKRQPVLVFGVGFFIVSHLLESTFIPLELVFEHRNYLGAAGLLLAPVYYLLAPTAPELKNLRWLAVPLLAILVFMTMARVKEWSNHDLLINIAIQEHPNSIRTRTEYASLLQGEQRIDEAIAQLEAAHVLDPTAAGPVLHALYLHCLQGQRNEQLFERSLALLTTPAPAYVLAALEGLLARQAEGACTVLTLDDSARLIEAALAVEGNQQHSRTRGFLLRLRGIHAFLSKKYVAGVVALRMAHEDTGLVYILSELFKYQLAFGQLGDAQDTLDYIKELNRFGVEDYLITQLEKIDREAARQVIPPTD